MREGDAKRPRPRRWRQIHHEVSPATGSSTTRRGAIATGSCPAPAPRPLRKVVVGDGAVVVVIAVVMPTPRALGFACVRRCCCCVVAVFTTGYCLLSGRQAVQTVVLGCLFRVLLPPALGEGS
ncbi:hypothetical protein PR202_ga19598 [Eleusine coracana subsp. coracana]|uniref:Uncharacterized protein n=1 Tax=Eleusine coracana subsp. coracana TaxID=191504 RepID=A0AAV5CW60_ELECO|nr:hypothetical protein PR202_ga19598 [Eleusine coracana subsp. coracana]